MTTVHVVVGCDTDPDRRGFLDGVPADRLTWRGMTEGIPAVKRLLEDVRDARGHEPVFTWLLRADEQVRALEGDYGWAAVSQAAMLRDLEARGDEIGWHPHFWRREAAGGPWYQEVEDRDWQVTMLRKAHAALATALPGRIRSVRMGWDYHNDRTIAALDELGIAVDFSALPGMRTFRAAPGTRGENFFDWRTTPRAAYHPSRADYRRPPRTGEPALALLEVPSFVSTSGAWALLSGLQLARKAKAPWQLWDAVTRPTYWIGVTAKPVWFAPLVAALRRHLRRHRASPEPVIFATYLHPDELLPNKSALYSLDSVRTNLRALLRACEMEGASVEFTAAGRLPAVCESPLAA